MGRCPEKLKVQDWYELNGQKYKLDGRKHTYTKSEEDQGTAKANQVVVYPP
jgi:hypothetical protein